MHEGKDRISRALGSIRKLDVLKKVVDFAMSDEVRAQDSIFVIVAVALNPKGRDMTWEFFKENSELQKQFDTEAEADEGTDSDVELKDFKYDKKELIAFKKKKMGVQEK